jgi:hypothetical protein
MTLLYMYKLLLVVLASIACQSGTASYHSNNSLAECILSRNTEIRVNNSYFFCKEGQPIDFTEKGIFSGCVLSESIEIRRTGGVENVRDRAQDILNRLVE